VYLLSRDGATAAMSFPIPQMKLKTSRYSRSLSFRSAVAEWDSERTRLLSERTRGTLERSGDGFNGRPGS
jgi:hypothetical protein